MVPFHTYLVQMLFPTSLVMPFIDFNARATSCNSVVRINFIGVNKLRGGLIQTLKLSMAAILGHVHFSFLNGLWLTHPFSIWHLSLHSEFCILNLGTRLWGSPRLIMFSFVPSPLHCYCKNNAEEIWKHVI